jgi:Pel9A-like, right handed beta helix region/Secretion system C-terminal sorting domain
MTRTRPIGHHIRSKSTVKIASLIVAALIPLVGSAATYYVSPTGDDNNPGSLDLPFQTIPKGVSLVNPGDTLYVRGGSHPYNTTISISKQGADTSWFCLLAYPGERPLLDFSAMPISSSLRGISLSGSYWLVRGFDIFKAGDNGMQLRGSNNIIEFCTFVENNDTGLQLDNGASNNQIINCDSYFNVDPSQGNADGFAAKLGVGSGNSFYGCRAWQNSDDGYDGYLRGTDDVTTTLENCWIFSNGYLKSGAPSIGNGNGFKMGGSDDRTLMHNVTLTNCLAFNNRVKGFDQNNNKGSMTLYNCTGYGNGTNYSVSQALNTGKTLTVKNCLSLGPYGSIGSFAVQETNSWMPPFVVTNDDFISIDTAGVHAPRNFDGSLPPITFMHLAEGSDLIDAGTDVGLPFNGNAPDLGCFETEGTTSVGGEVFRPFAFRLNQNYPNPFNPSTIITFAVAKTARATLEVFDIRGRKVATLFNDVAEAGQEYKIRFSPAALSSGTYFYVLESGGKNDMKKLTLVK